MTEVKKIQKGGKPLLEIFDLSNEPDLITKIIDNMATIKRFKVTDPSGRTEIMKRKLFHLTIKATGEHKYYGSLAAVFLDNRDLNVSKFSLDRYDFTTPFENEVCTIRKAFMSSSGDIRETALK